MEEIYSKLFLYLIITMSAVFHEYFHAWTANWLGDPTAKNEGRLTLNPIPHLDVMGTVIIPLVLLFGFGGFIGWAKPVPFNPYNLRNQKIGPALVGLSGPLANFILAIIFGLSLRFFAISPNLAFFLALIVYVNIFLGLFNLLPIPPLDGSKLFASFLPPVREGFIGMLLAILIAIYVLRFVANFIFWGIVGQAFLF